MWPDRRLIDLLDVTHPIIQAPMAGATTPEMALAAGRAGALGSLGTAMATADAVRELGGQIASISNHPMNFNFFCHEPVTANAEISTALAQTLQSYYDEFDLGQIPAPAPSNFPFDADMCAAVRSFGPKVVSFHFGLPDADLVSQLKSDGILILSSATTVAEAVWLEQHGADAIIAQGWEAGGHRGFFLTPEDTKIGLMALVPAVVDAVSVPVIAAGGIADGRGIAAAMVLGASGVQIGTALLNSPESCVPEIHKTTLLGSEGSNTRTTKVFSGRPARGIANRYMNETEQDEVSMPAFPIMNTMTGPLRKASAAQGKPDFVSLWSGQAVGLNQSSPVQETIETLAKQAQAILNRA